MQPSFASMLSTQEIMCSNISISLCPLLRMLMVERLKSQRRTVKTVKTLCMCCVCHVIPRKPVRGVSSQVKHNHTHIRSSPLNHLNTFLRTHACQYLKKEKR